jgi:23S rRNA (uracil1939-C5)-methyltransferase
MGKRPFRADKPAEAALIRDLTSDGRGVAATSGKAVFVNAAITGEFVRFRRQRRRKNLDEAELLEVLQASPDRAEPPCEYYSVCGGCSLQHLSPDAQLATKQSALSDALERIGSVEPEAWLPPLAGRSLGYRRRARMGARLVEKKGRVLVGFREKLKPYIAEMRSCATLAEELSQLIDPLAELIGSLSIARHVPQIEMSQGDASTALIFRVLEDPPTKDRELLERFGAERNIQIWLQTGGPDTLTTLDRSVPVEPLWYELPEFDVRLQFGPLDFIQVNQDMNRRMMNQAMELLGPLEGQSVLDLFCGIGNFSLPLARTADSVVGVELDHRMVAKASANAAANGITNAVFHAADLADGSNLPDWWRQGFDVVVLDPPRAGALEALAPINQAKPGRILYVSCHPGSLARDAGMLVNDYGYRLVRAGAMDMFPQTSHVEAMALFER